MRGGKAFTQPLPLSLGSNGAMFRYGISTTDLNAAKSMGMQYYRNDITWVVNQGSTPIESTPGTYSSSAITNAINVANAVKAAGLKPLFVVTVAQNPGMCPTLSSALTSSDVYTSISITPLAFAITSGDSIVLTNPANQSQTQTVVAAASKAIGYSGSVAVNSFTANHNYATGTWVYDTAWVASTPQHFSDMMVELVSQTGLQGLDWELFNEPDGSGWGVQPALLIQAYELAYPAMKDADPTCVIHSSPVESLSTPGYGDGTDYLNELYAINPTFYEYYDVFDFHQYSTAIGWATNDCPPDAAGAYGLPFWQLIATYRHLMVSRGDTSIMWMTEFGWQNTDDGQMTPALQAQFYQNLLLTLSGWDPINQCLFSSYLKVAIQYAMEGGGSQWGIISEPAQTVITKLVAGTP